MGNETTKNMKTIIVICECNGKNKHISGPRDTVAWWFLSLDTKARKESDLTFGTLSAHYVRLSNAGMLREDISSG